MPNRDNRRGRAALAAALVLVMVAVLVPATADAAPRLKCNSRDLRFPFMPGGAKTFGVFYLRITNGTCKTAHRVAKAWMTKFEASASAKPPRRAAGFSFETLPANEAQSYRERGRRGETTIRFKYRVPNG